MSRTWPGRMARCTNPTSCSRRIAPRWTSTMHSALSCSMDPVWSATAISSLIISTASPWRRKSGCTTRRSLPIWLFQPRRSRWSDTSATISPSTMATMGMTTSQSILLHHPWMMLLSRISSFRKIRSLRGIDWKKAYSASTSSASSGRIVTFVPSFNVSSLGYSWARISSSMADSLLAFVFRFRAFALPITARRRVNSRPAGARLCPTRCQSTCTFH